jgi:hypothetical protein
MNDLKTYQSEEFYKLLPYLELMLSKFEIDTDEKVYSFKGFDFIATKRNGFISFGLVSEKPIYPTLVFEYLPNGSTRLLHYRIDNELPSKIKYLTIGAV